MVFFIGVSRAHGGAAGVYSVATSASTGDRVIRYCLPSFKLRSCYVCCFSCSLDNFRGIL